MTAQPVAPPLTHLTLALPTPGGDSRYPLPPGITLRTADPAADWPRIAELYNAAFELAPEEGATPEQVGRLAYHPGLTPLGVVLAFDGDLAVGLSVGRIEVPAPGQAERQGAVELIAVRPSYRRRGLAHALLAAVLAWLAGQDIGRVAASTPDAATIHLLRQHGFVEVEAPAAGPAGDWM